MNGRGLHNYLHSDDLVFFGIFQPLFPGIMDQSLHYY